MESGGKAQVMTEMDPRRKIRAMCSLTGVNILRRLLNLAAITHVVRSCLFRSTLNYRYAVLNTTRSRKVNEFSNNKQKLEQQ
jgi:hypothetical protein